jgi:hypothetical protein
VGDVEIQYHRLSGTSGLGSNPANREITSSSGASEYQDILFFDFYSFFLKKVLWKNLKKYDLTRPKVSKYSAFSCAQASGM